MARDQGNSLEKALEVAACTDAGRVREHNEDAVFAKPSLGLAILADGMGGYNAGEVASEMAVSLLSADIEEGLRFKAAWEMEPDGVPYARALLQERIVTANATIHHAAQTDPSCSGMGTTLVLALFADNQLTVAHIGDSRLYRWRGGRLEQLTKDHSLLQVQIDSGLLTPEQARKSQQKNLLTRALGSDPEVEPEIHSHEVVSGDLYLLCSDGLNDMLDDEDIARLLASATDLAPAASALIQAANAGGGRDNVSAILIRVRGDFSAPRNCWSRLKAWLR